MLESFRVERNRLCASQWYGTPAYLGVDSRRGDSVNRENNSMAEGREALEVTWERITIRWYFRGCICSQYGGSPRAFFKIKRCVRTSNQEMQSALLDVTGKPVGYW